MISIKHTNLIFLLFASKFLTIQTKTLELTDNEKVAHRIILYIKKKKTKHTAVYSFEAKIGDYSINEDLFIVMTHLLAVPGNGKDLRAVQISFFSISLCVYYLHSLITPIAS